MQRLLGLVCALLLLSLPAAQAATPRPGDPFLSLALADFGFDPVPARYLTGSATMFTLHFVDATHLLLTFNARGLMTRLPDAMPDDEDRLVDALLLELPTGKVLTRTQWRTRDRDQYLWPLAEGRFLLRVRTRLVVLDPVRNLAAGDAFHETAFIDLHRRIGYIAVSPGGDLLTIETMPTQHTDAAATALSAAINAANAQAQAQAIGHSSQSGVPIPAGNPTLSRSPPLASTLQVKTDSDAVEIHFYRMTIDSSPKPNQPAVRLLAQSAGLIPARALLNIPATAEGFLDVSRESAKTWLFDFQTHDGGKRLELAAFDTSCAPRPYFISRTEFVSFGCRGASDRLEFSGFNLRGEQPWIQVLSGTQIAPLFATAPAAGRFAFSHIAVSGTLYDIQNLSPDEIQSQEIVVLQHYDGRVLLRVLASPVQRTGQNFDIAPDGLNFALLRNGRIDVIHLPALTSKDQEQVKLAAAALPPARPVTIRLQAANTPATPNPASPGGPLPNPAAADVPAVSAVDAPAPTAPEPVGSSPADPNDPTAPPRTPPTLYSPEHPKD